LTISKRIVLSRSSRNADRKKDVYDGDIEAIIMSADSTSPGPWTLQSLKVQTRTGEDADASVVLLGEDGKEVAYAAEGDGPVAASNFEVHSASVGEDAQGEVTVTVEHDGSNYRGHGASVDIVEAGARAYLEVINRVLRRRQKDTNPQGGDATRATV
jgi:2-isopropylmalate synthase